MNGVESILRFVLENDFDDTSEEWKDTEHQTQWEAGTWLKRTLEPLGFKNRGMNTWEKRKGKMRASVSPSAQMGKALMTLYVQTDLGRWLKETYAVRDYDSITGTLIGWGIIR